MKKCLILLSVFFLLGSISFGALMDDYELTSGPKASVYDLGDTTRVYV